MFVINSRFFIVQPSKSWVMILKYLKKNYVFSTFSILWVQLVYQVIAMFIFWNDSNSHIFDNSSQETISCLCFSSHCVSWLNDILFVSVLIGTYKLRWSDFLKINTLMLEKVFYFFFFIQKTLHKNNILHVT